jgi:hypothetical protein
MMIDENDQVLLGRAVALKRHADSVISFLSEYLKAKYKLNPTQVIDERGEIIDIPDSNGPAQLDEIRQMQMRSMEERSE